MEKRKIYKIWFGFNISKYLGSKQNKDRANGDKRRRNRIIIRRFASGFMSSLAGSGIQASGIGSSEIIHGGCFIVGGLTSRAFIK